MTLPRSVSGQVNGVCGFGDAQRSLVEFIFAWMICDAHSTAWRIHMVELQMQLLSRLWAIRTRIELPHPHSAPLECLLVTQSQRSLVPGGLQTLVDELLLAGRKKSTVADCRADVYRIRVPKLEGESARIRIESKLPTDH